VNIENRNSEELCRYRLHQAEDTITEAMLLQNSGHYRGAVNRAYYAMFYAIQVLIVQNKVKVSKHSATISYFDRHFVKTGFSIRIFRNGSTGSLICDKTPITAIFSNPPRLNATKR
jgi:uncharacterized protein (UPF0332 family)